MIPSKKIVRRYFKNAPLLFIENLKEKGYEINQAEANKIVVGIKPKAKKKTKTVLKRYGRYNEMIKNIDLYHSTKELKYLQTAQKLRDNMTKQYKLLYSFKDEDFIIFFNATTDYKRVLEFSKRIFKNKQEIIEAHWTATLYDVG